MLNLNYYAEDLLNPLSTKTSGDLLYENDIAHGENLLQKKFKRFKQFYKTVRAHYPNPNNIAYVSIKYSPSREQF